MSKKKAKLSKREKEAKKKGTTVKVSSKSSKKSSSSSSDEKKAKKEAAKYYKEKKSDAEKKAEMDTTKYEEDLRMVMRDAGITQTRATEDYLRNIKNIEANKSAEVADINDYVTTQKGRTGEDLDTSLAKESRRYALETDKINQDLADSGLTFSERTSEKIAAGGTAETQKGIQTEAERSFQDIARYEAVKNRDIELKYGQQEEKENVSKTRTLEDVLNEQADANLKAQRGKEDVAFGKATDIRDINYQAKDEASNISNYYEEQRGKLDDKNLTINVVGA